MEIRVIILIFVALAKVVVTGRLVLVMSRGAREGLAKLDHRESELPQVMTGRYLSFFVMAVMAVIYGDPKVLLGLQLAFLVASLADTWIYWKSGHAYGRHFMAGIASALAALLLAWVIWG